MNIQSKIPKIYILLFGIFIVLVIQMLFINNMTRINFTKPSREAYKGDIFISDWIDEKSIYILDGEWEFINELIDPSQLTAKHLDYAIVPGSWSSGFLPQNYKGFATYRIRIHVPDSLVGETFGLRTSNIRQDYKIYVQNKLAYSNGDFSKNSVYFPSGLPRSNYFELKDNIIEVIIQTKNDILNNPGIGHSVLFGKEEVIRDYSMTKNNMDILLFSIMMSISVYLFIYYWIFYANKYKNTSYLILSINSLMFAMSSGGYREKLLFQFLYNINSSALYWIHDLSRIGYYISLLILLYQARKKDYPKLIFYILSFYVLFLLIIILLLPISIFGAYFDLLSLTLYAYFLLIILLEIKIITHKLRRKRNSFYVLSLVSLPAFYSFSIIVYQSSSLWFDVLVNSSIIFFVFFMLSHTFIDGIQTIKKNQYLSEQNAINKFAFLQSQIKPHFLFNTFSSIQGMIEINPQKAQALISNLSDYLRKAFDFNPNHFLVSIENELQHVRTYIIIENERYVNRFIVDYEVDDSILTCPILQCSIQPIVENALRHGILVRTVIGKISISIKRDQNMIVVQVKDNGIGCDAKLLLEKLNSDSNIGGVALSNINNRLIKLYGKGLSIESEEFVGTIVSFCYPYSELGK